MLPVAVDHAAKLLPDSSTEIIEYVVTDDNTYLFVLTKKHQPGSSTDVPILNAYTINIKQKDLAAGVERFRSRLTQKDTEFSDFARQLYELLIGPARSYLKNQTRLIIVPDGVLCEVTF